jgi:hypothetical protein
LPVGLSGETEQIFPDCVPYKIASTTKQGRQIFSRQIVCNKLTYIMNNSKNQCITGEYVWFWVDGPEEGFIKFGYFYPNVGEKING